MCFLIRFFFQLQTILDGNWAAWAVGLRIGYLSMKKANLSIPASNNSRHLHKSKSIGTASRSSVFHLGCTGGMWLPGLNSHPHFVYVVVVWCCFFIIRASHSSELLYVCVCVCHLFGFFLDSIPIEITRYALPCAQ